MLSIFGKVKNGKMLDYISAWFYFGAKYASTTNAKVAFVSTNSVTQGNRFLSYGMSYSSLEFKSILPINLLNGRIMLKIMLR